MKKIGLQGGPKKPIVSGVIAVIAPGKRVITPRNGSQGNAVEIEATLFSLFLVLFFTDSTKGKSPFTQRLGCFFPSIKQANPGSVWSLVNSVILGEQFGASYDGTLYFPTIYLDIQGYQRHIGTGFPKPGHWFRKSGVPIDVVSLNQKTPNYQHKNMKNNKWLGRGYVSSQKGILYSMFSFFWVVLSSWWAFLSCLNEHFPDPKWRASGCSEVRVEYQIGLEDHHNFVKKNPGSTSTFVFKWCTLPNIKWPHCPICLPWNLFLKPFLCACVEDS